MKKAFEGEVEDDRLGLRLEGEAGNLHVPIEKALARISLGLWLYGEERPRQIWSQIFAGEEVHRCQYRRPLFSTYSSLRAHIARARPRQAWSMEANREVLCALALSPARVANLRAGLCPDVAASDASMSGGGICVSRGLASTGFKEARELVAGEGVPNGEKGRLREKWSADAGSQALVASRGHLNDLKRQ